MTLNLEGSKQLSGIQHGLRPGTSVFTAAVSFAESVIESVDKDEYTTGIFMGLIKALLDSVRV